MTHHDTNRHARPRRPVAQIASAVALAWSVALWWHPAAAQTRFVWPAAKVDVSRYTTVDECRAATLRMRDSTNHRSAAWRDTLPWDPNEVSEPLPAPVVATAQRCGARFLGDSASLKDFALLLQLYLDADRDADAEALVRRRLAAIPPKADSLRAAVLDSIAGRYLESQPRRLDLAEPIIEQLARSKAISPGTRLMHWFMLARYAQQADDTARARRASEGVLAVVGTLTDPQKREFDVMLKYLTFGALARLHHAEAMDSLRRGTAAYAALAGAAWALASGESPEAFMLPIGKRAPALQGKFWFVDGAQGAAAASGPPVRPTPGRVSLVVFAPRGPCLAPQPGSCWEDYALVRRLARRFPELEITMVGKTLGYYWELEPPAPAEEAEAMRKVWTELHHLPGTYVVHETEFFRLPGLDRRRINRDDPNETRYDFGKTWKLQSQTRSYLLVDRDGLIVDAGGTLERPAEAELAERIEILLQRSGKGTT